MKLSIPRSELKQAVAGFTKIVNGKVTLPILGGVRFENGKHGVTAQVTDLDQHLRYRFGEAQAQGEGALILPLTNLKDLVQGKALETIEFETMSDGNVSVTNHVGDHAVKHPLAGMDPEEWPVSPAEVATNPATGFLDTYRKLVPFASTDSTRYVLQGVFIDVADQGEHPVTMVATDGRRLSLWNTMNLPLPRSAIVPTTRFLQWPGLQGDAEIGLRTERQKKDVRVLGFVLRLGPWWYDVRAVDGTYPNWRQVIPAADAMANRITFTDEDAMALRKILPTFPGHGSQNDGIGLNPGAEGRLVISGRGPDDKTDTTLELTGGSRCEGATPIGVNREFLLEALTAGFRVFTYRDETCPLRSEDGKGGIHVLMPLRLGPSPATGPEPKHEGANTPTHQAPENASTGPVAPAHEPEPKGENTTMTQEGTTTKGTNEHGTALDRLQAAYEVARQKVRDANQALADVAGAIKDAAKENRQLKADVENVRTGLAKLQSIKV